jgi:DNA-binding NtrC family response regulator
MSTIVEDLKLGNRGANSLDALKSLTRLLAHEVASLAEIAGPQASESPDAGIDLNDRVQRYEATLICKALAASNGNQAQAAKKLGIKSTTLHAKIRRHGIDSAIMYGQFAQEDC